MAFIPGQRWISNAEPELGLGTVVRRDGRIVEVLFATAGVLRRYAAHAAPLSRVEFRIGQKVSGQKRQFVIERVSEAGGLLSYHGGGLALSEAELDDTQPVSRADERLLAARTDSPERFDFRLDARQRRASALAAPAFGIASARVGLIPHQLRVAEIVAGRQPPRALLADEVGLGKTIEAGLILARLLASGRIERVLVLVPASLSSQWLVELRRRFNLDFAFFDEERCAAIALTNPQANPFEEEQCLIAAVDWLAASPLRAQQLLAAGWDLVVVDEAHHLEWTPEGASPAYSLVESLAARVPGLILLTATPQQLGRSGHFARLRLLDPARYADLAAFTAESEGYVQLSAIAAQLLDARALSPTNLAELRGRFADDEVMLACVDGYAQEPKANAAALLDALIDRHGTGRVMFRNRREQVGGFPRRVPRIEIRDARELDESARQALLAEFHADTTDAPAPAELDYSHDPRLSWLLRLLEELAGAKLLVICRSQAKVLAIEAALRLRSGVAVARFHEGMGLLQRDRHAAWFAQADGARLLLCSEIGSEGRNFQFAHHLVLWDLPLDPDLLEQRIGRLDRIGQREDVILHTIAYAGTAQHALLRWHHEGLDALRSSPPDGREILRRHGARILRLAERHATGGEAEDAELDSLLAETAASHRELVDLVNAGRDRLLELAGERQARDGLLAAAMQALDADVAADEFVLRLFEQFGIAAEESGHRSFVLDPEYLATDALAGFADGPQLATFDRATALAREELPLLRLDHPLVAGALDLLLESEQGNAAVLVDAALPPRSALLECVFVLDCVAERKLHIGRFLPPLPLHVTVDTRLAVRTGYRPEPASLRRAREQPPDALRLRPMLARLVPPMLAACETEARRQAAAEIGTALGAAERELGAARNRLAALARVNPSVRQEEVDALARELEAIRAALATAAPRLDALRFACSPDVLPRPAAG